MLRSSLYIVAVITGAVTLAVVTAVTLAVVTTSPLFSKFLADRSAAKEHRGRVERSHENVGRYQSLLVEDCNAIAEYLAAQALERAVSALQPDDIEQLRHLFRAIEHTAAHVPLGCPLKAPSSYTGDEKAVREKRIQDLVAEGRLNRFGPESTGPSLDLRKEAARFFAARRIEVAVKKPSIRDLSARFAAGMVGAEAIARQTLAADQVEHQPATEEERRLQSECLAAQSEKLKFEEARTAQRQALASGARMAFLKLFSTAVGVIEPETGIALPPLQIKGKQESPLLQRYRELRQREHLAAPSEEPKSQEVRTDQQQAAEGGAEGTVTNASNAAVGKGTPDSEGLAGVFAKELVSACVERIFKHGAAWWVETAHDVDSSQGELAAAFIEASLPPGDVARRLLVLRNGSEEQSPKPTAESRAEIERQVESWTMDRQRAIREYIDRRELTANERLWAKIHAAGSVEELQRQTAQRRKMMEESRQGRRR